MIPPRSSRYIWDIPNSRTPTTSRHTSHFINFTDPHQRVENPTYRRVGGKFRSQLGACRRAPSSYRGTIASRSWTFRVAKRPSMTQTPCVRGSPAVGVLRDETRQREDCDKLKKAILVMATDETPDDPSSYLLWGGESRMDLSLHHRE